MRYCLLSLFIMGMAAHTTYSQPSSGYSPSYKYTNLQLRNLSGPVEKLIYADDGSSVTFDKNGNIIQEKDKYVENNYSYNDRGYVILNQYGAVKEEWQVTIDEQNRQRLDRRIDAESEGKVNMYSFDEKGRHIGSVYEETGRIIIVSIHYANDKTFLPDSSWVTTYLAGYLDDETVIAYWYNKLDRHGNWLEVQEQYDKTRYYAAYYTIRQVGYFNERLISRAEIARMKELIHGPRGERISTGNNKSGQLAMVDKEHEPTEYEKNISTIYEAQTVPGHQRKTQSTIWGIILVAAALIAIILIIVSGRRR